MHAAASQRGLTSRYGRMTIRNSLGAMAQTAKPEQLRPRTLEAFRDKRLFEAFLEGRQSIADDLVFPSTTGTVLHPENLLHRYFLPCVERAGLRRRFRSLWTLTGT